MKRHTNRTLSHRAVGRIAGFLLAFTIAGLSGCTGSKLGTCQYREAPNRGDWGIDPSRSSRVSSAAECSHICSGDPENSGCWFTPQKTAITGP